MEKDRRKFVGRGGDKLKFAIDKIGLQFENLVGADLGCNIGGFTDCMLQEGARHIYAIDTGYGMLEWKLRCDERVTVMERTNAMHVKLPEKVDVVSIDVGWTPQRHILPAALNVIKKTGFILSLFKPQYEAEKSLVKKGGFVDSKDFNTVLESTLLQLRNAGISVKQTVMLPRTQKKKNLEAMLYILPDKKNA